MMMIDELLVIILITCILCITLSIERPISERPITLLKQRTTKALLTKEWESPKRIYDIRHLLSRYDSFVPVIGRQTGNVSYLDIRRDMFDIGLYPGVEYRITDITLDSNPIDPIKGTSGQSISSLIGLINKKDTTTTTPFITSNNDDIDYSNSRNNDNITINNDNDVILSVRPVYPLIDELEREWPVSLRLNQAPYYLSKGMYNTITVMGSLSISILFFMTCFILSNMFTVSFVNSRSMETTIYPKDLILVEKITPLISRELLHTHTAKENDIIFFQQPPKLIEYIKEQESKDNFNRRKTLSSDLIVKRVKTVIDDNDNHHHYYDVRGDNSDYSVDSRMIGLIDEKYIVGHPILRIYPKFGTLP